MDKTVVIMIGLQGSGKSTFYKLHLEYDFVRVNLDTLKTRYQEKLLIQAHGNKQTIEAMLEGFQYQEQEMLKLFEKGDALRQGIDELNAAKAKYPNHQ